MGNERYCHTNLHIHHHKTTFLPMLCSRLSIKDVRLPASQATVASSSNDPLSPRIGCMGQVKRNSRVVGFPASQQITKLKLNTTNKTNISYTKLRKLFSSKHLAAATPTAANGLCPTPAGNKRQVVMAVNGSTRARKNGVHRSESCGSMILNIDDMDPPLPVIKRVQKSDDGGGESDSLWKRRSGGVALKSLQIQHLSQPRHHNLHQPTTV